MFPREERNTVMRKRIGDPLTIFMNATPVAKIAKTRLEEIRVSVLRNNKVDVRTYFHYPQEPEPKPTKKGLMLSFKYIPQILAAFGKLLKDEKYEFNLLLNETEKEQLKTYAGDYKGARLVHIRSFYRREGVFQPGKGIAFPRGLLVPVIDALKRAEELKD